MLTSKFKLSILVVKNEGEKALSYVLFGDFSRVGQMSNLPKWVKGWKRGLFVKMREGRERKPRGPR